MEKIIPPMGYLIYSRLKTKHSRVSWILIYLVPLYLLGLYLGSYNSVSLYTVMFILTFLSFYTLYDIGYLYNDIFTTKKERYPNLRVEKDDYTIFKKCYKKIVFLKIAIFSLLIVVVWLCSFLYHQEVYILDYLSLIFGVSIAFFAHNTIRSRYNILTFFILSSLKYIAPLSIFLEWDIFLNLWVVSVAVFPLLRVIEHSTKDKYQLKRWKKLIGSHDRFRVFYYLFIVVCSYLFLDNRDIYISILLYWSSYFLLYRLFIYMILKSGIYKRRD